MILLEFLMEFVAYNIGYFIIKFITAGKYPQKYLEDGGSIGVEIVGVITFLVVVLPIFYFVFK